VAKQLLESTVEKEDKDKEWCELPDDDVSGRF
jgi:hypothetical protein